MDIQISSNLERLLFEFLDEDGSAVTALLDAFRREGRVELPPPVFARMAEQWRGARVDDAATVATMRQVHEESGLVIDPHTAVGVAAARRLADGHHQQLVMATAHPAKFPDAVERATGTRPELPAHLDDLFDRPEIYTALPNDLSIVQGFVESVVH
jgi:threonine synthase